MLAVVSASTKLCTPQAQPLISATHRLARKTKMLASEMKMLEAKDIKKQLQVNDAIAKKMIEDLGKMESATPTPCSLLYHNPFWEAFHAESLDEDGCDFAQKHVRIFSGFYGLLRPFDAISPKAPPLLMTNKIPTTKGKILRSWWEEPVQQQILEDVKRMPGPPYTIMSLANDDDIDLLNTEMDGVQIVRVTFQGIGDDVMACKGEFMRWFVETQPFEVTDLYDFTGQDDESKDPRFRLDMAASKGNLIVFESVDRRGDWTKKLSQSGVGQKEFLKTAAYGSKNMWRRQEIESELGGKKHTVKIKQARQKARNMD
eukprot:GEMP01037959.1.p1 GENE.GEMP01037959.1~~GEMP01037959.1.p1  ORF type:complete len:315 (+),score=80.91 GEMP01037959.1:240-1184(+)